MEQRSAGFLQADVEAFNSEIQAADKLATKESVKEAQQKAKEAAKKASDSKKKIEDLKAKQAQHGAKPVIASAHNTTTNATAAAKVVKDVDPKPPANEKLQVQSTMDVK